VKSFLSLKEREGDALLKLKEKEREKRTTKTMTTPEEGASAAVAAAPEGDGGEKNGINSELWQACAGPLVNLPIAGTHVVYFPQGHSEQVT
jgi:hypothetical protein